MMPQTSLIPWRLWPQPQLPTQMSRLWTGFKLYWLYELCKLSSSTHLDLSSSSNSDSDADFLSVLIWCTHCIHCFHVGLNFRCFSALYHCHSALYIFILLYILCHSPTCMCYALWAQSNNFELWTCVPWAHGLCTPLCGTTPYGIFEHHCNPL